ncbi:MAG: methanogen output domain 1-containing protein [Euryarchaeota archaeon]|jgi:CheY-like chemotaxis protein|uniref:response regulator n=1 Tax=Methanobacterium sp. MZD130B TaxID=3394378 RepID=UPI001768E1B1|nr:methanogen output domain 1-containing protein [Euryarchaeota archaeon]HHT19211.1 response regulator [Methanobacterium sp.]
MVGETILVVEDEGISAIEIQESLESLGYYVPAIAKSGNEAIQEAFAIKPDLILMDITLQGDMDGIDAATIIKSFMDIPLIYLTALDDMETFQRMMDTRATAYLIKPIEEATLRNNIELALKNYEMTRKELEEEKKAGLKDVQIFMRSALPELVSKMPVPERSAFLSRFMRLFEQNMKPLFTNFAREYSQKPYDELDDDEKMKIYLSWISQLYENLGFKVQTRSRANRGIMTVKKCSWAPSKPHDIFLCLICQSIMKLTYSWTNLPGTVESEPTTGILQSVCKFDYNMEI